MCFLSSSLMPTPLSAMVIFTTSLSDSSPLGMIFSVTSTLPPSGVYFMAFDNRFSMIFLTLSESNAMLKESIGEW